MRFRYMAIVGALGIASGLVPSPVDAAVVTDFNGSYELKYTSSYLDFAVSVITPKGKEYDFPIVVSVPFDANEHIPYSEADKVVHNAEMVLENYYPTMPANLESAILTGLSKALYAAIDEINAQSEAMPDFMNLSTVSSKTGTMSGVFVDESAGTQTSMVGTMVVAPDGKGSIELMPFMEGIIDSANGYSGKGDFYVQDLQVSEVVKGYQVSIAGDMLVYFDMYRGQQ